MSPSLRVSSQNAKTAGSHPWGRFARQAGAGLALLGCLQSFASCGGDEFDSCEAHRSCPTTTGGGAGTGGSDASGGISGNSSGGSTTGGSSAGSGGSAAGGLEAGGSGGEDSGGASGGTGGTGGSPGCDGDCSGDTPVCDVASNSCVQCRADGDCSAGAPLCNATTHTCVQCLAKSDCSDDAPICNLPAHACIGCLVRGDCRAPTPACDTASNTCVPCTANTDCKGATPLCDTETNACVACLTQTDCPDPSASQCDTESHTCKPCSTNAHCSDVDGKNVCEGGVCVECSAQDASACGSSGGTPYVCDSKLHTCTSRKERSSGLCGACVSDKECPLGELCILDSVGSGATAKQAGYFCHWKKGDTANGAPARCSDARPFVQTAVGATSIDGETTDVCTLAVSSCPARNEFRSKSCSSNAVPDDKLCGVAAPLDAKCVLFDTDDYRCTMTCLSNDDCPPSVACNTALGLCSLSTTP